MSNQDNQNDLPIETNGKRSGVEFLPKYFRTLPNKKFIAATLDQIIQQGVAEKLNGYFGRKNSKARKLNDTYISEVSTDRENYQLEPSAIIKDELDNIIFQKDYNDYTNQIANLAGNNENQSHNNEQEYYAWNPHIDWDKFVNFREYYWLPFGPSVINIFGQSRVVESTYTVTVTDEKEQAYVFTPDGFTRNPTLTLYRGQTYKFEINCPGHPIAFSTDRQFTPLQVFVTAAQDGIRAPGKFDVKLFDVDSYDYGDFYLIPPSDELVEKVASENISNLVDLGIQGITEAGESALFIEQGTIEFTIPDDAPDNLFYVSKNDIDYSGLIIVKDIEENSVIDIEKEVIGKKTYKSANGVEFMNGMVVTFGGEVSPKYYQDKQFYVEGVGNKITLIHDKDLEFFSSLESQTDVPFDSNPFDRVPFSLAEGFQGTKDYIVSNRASPDKNHWARTNNWIHRTVILESAKINNIEPEFDENFRGTRPIIEFESGMKLANFGTIAKLAVDLVDTFTNDIFSIIEGSEGYNIDGVSLVNGMRILFTNDNDILVNNKIYEVKFITFQNKRQITLIETEDSDPLENEIVYVKNGQSYKGKMFYFDSKNWKQGQNKERRNQAIEFDLYDQDGVSIFDYSSVINPGSKIFSYQIGSGANDPELGFPLQYRTVENSGDILFNFDMLSDIFTYQINDKISFIPAEKFRVRIYNTRDNFTTESAWKKGKEKSYQNVIRIYNSTLQQNNFEIDVYDNAGEITNLWVRVYVNNKLYKKDVDYVIENINNRLFVVLQQNLDNESILEIKTRSSAPKNSNGYYEIPHNLERNPLNGNPTEFTFGEVSDHVQSIVEELPSFEGKFPGPSNLFNLGNITPLGRKFVQHSGPINLALYHLTHNSHNIVNAIEKSQQDYGKFKRELIIAATKSSFDGEIADRLDNTLNEINKTKNNFMSYYFTDMLGYSNKQISEYIVNDKDNVFYALPELFSLESMSNKAVYVYLNDSQLLVDKDYSITDNGFVSITHSLQVDDLIGIHFYENTDGSFIPSTPTKLGLFPAYEPKKYLDDSLYNPVNVLQGHDGSIMVAYDDFRDDLILEFEKRIYNNLKIKYNPALINIHDYLPSEYRNTKFDNKQIDKTIISDFTKWLSLIGNKDYTDIESIYNVNNSFTYNYINSNIPSNKNISGYWRKVYQYAYDTDRPHTHPWEMLGFFVKPNWWDDVYGPQPYTSNNLILWEDLQEGRVKEPGKPVKVLSKYARPGLLQHIPVDGKGQLKSPLESNYVKNFSQINSKTAFQFGDRSPIETAWRRSSDYPFAIIKSWIVNQPAHMFSVGFDRNQQMRDNSGEIIYKNTDKRIVLEDIIFPNTYNDEVRTFTSGLINYIFDFLTAKNLEHYEDYKNNLTNITNRLSLKVAGYTDKSKFNLILDSRTPLNQGNVFVPQENFDLYLKTSSPITFAKYSGVLIEKRTNGFVVRGYDKQQAYFNYVNPQAQTNDPTIKVGGVSETFLVWSENKAYTKGQIVEFEGSYFRCTEEHISESSLDAGKFSKLPALPITGGVSAYKRKVFNKDISTLNYGTVLSNVQDVVDFLYGYGEYLTRIGFRFNYFNSEYNEVENWNFSVKEFLFWTTQNWGPGTILTMSPGATSMDFDPGYGVIDSITSDKYEYSVLQSDGQSLNSNSISVNRKQDNTFTVSVKNTNEGIYAIKLPIVQKEHVVILDNQTIFKDVIYDLEPGYRQERIRVLGYRTADWDGSFSIPGFIYDNVNITTWIKWKDYSVGDVVKHKEFYYVAIENVPGSEVFDIQSWQRLTEKPEKTLQGNLDYKTNQFADFYDLDSDNFDTEQQKLAQHLIGYQDRQYLKNIINDDVSQYKFYQGMIQEKGSNNSLQKLFDKLSLSDKDSLEFYEEWAIKTGNYGAVDTVTELEYFIDESKLKLEPTPVELIDIEPSVNDELVTYITPKDTYLKREDYNHDPLPVVDQVDEYCKTAGYVHSSDVDYSLQNYDDILNLDISKLDNNQYFWIGNYKKDWQVFEYTYTGVKVVKSYIANSDSTSTSEGNIEIRFNKTLEIEDGEIIGLSNGAAEKFVKVLESGSNFVIVNDETLIDINFKDYLVTKFVSRRFSDFTTLAGNATKNSISGKKVWIDNIASKWTVFENQNNFEINTQTSNQLQELDTKYLSSYSLDDKNRLLAIGTPNSGNGRVLTYNRAANKFNFEAENDIKLPVQLDVNIGAPEICDPNPGFGKSVAFTPDGKYLLVGSPDASGVKTKFVGEYDENLSYYTGDIVKHFGKFWEAQTTIPGALSSRPYATFASVGDLNVADAFLLTGEYPFTNIDTDHILVRVPKDIYDSVSLNEKLSLYYIDALSGTDIIQQPFRGTITGLDNQFINDSHNILQKIDSVLFVKYPFDIPSVGTVLKAGNNTVTVVDVFEKNNSFSIYVTHESGVDTTGELVSLDGFVVGEYELVAPLIGDSSLGNYFKISTTSISPLINVRDINTDGSNRFVIKDILTLTETESDANIFYAIEENTRIVNTVESENDQTKYIAPLSFDGNVEGESRTVLSNKWVIRLPYNFDNDDGNLSNNIVDNIDSSSFRLKIDPTTSSSLNETGLAEIFEDIHQIYEVWDGYIEITVDTPPDENTLSFVYAREGNIITDENGNTATVKWVETKGNIQRLYVVDSSTAWPKGSKYGESTRLFITDIQRTFVDFEFGFLRASSISGVNPLIGKLAVIEHSENIQAPQTQTVTDTSYWIYDSNTVDGLGTSSIEPSANAQEWIFTNRLVTDNTGDSSSRISDGLISVFERSSAGGYAPVINFTTDYIENQQDNFGSYIYARQKDTEYRNFVRANDKLWFVFKNDLIDWNFIADNNFRGSFTAQENYLLNDIVEYSNGYYQAKTNLLDDGNIPAPTLTQTDSNWQYLDYQPNTGFIPVSLNANVSIDKSGDTIAILEDDLLKIYRNIDQTYTLQFTKIVDPFEGEFTTPPNRPSYNETLALNDDGSILAIGFYKFGYELDGVEYRDFSLATGKVILYNLEDNNATLFDTLYSPDKELAEEFGSNIQFSKNNLLITSRAGDLKVSEGWSDQTYFDDNFTNFKTTKTDFGKIYHYELINNSFVYSTSLSNDLIYDKFGYSILYNNESIFVAFEDKEELVEYIKTSQTAWTVIREEQKPVDIHKIKNLFVYNKDKKIIDSYLEFIDPIQGKFAGIAEQELSYKTYYDPAVYTIGSDKVSINRNNSWGPDQIGKVWLDLTNIKFYNPYQQDIKYSTNNWNKLFFGASVDVYEWVESSLLPSEWNEIADSTDGITIGVSGQTKYNDTVYCERKIYDPIAQAVSSKYYYWVKNKTIIPNIEGRNKSIAEIADIISNPAGQGIKFVAPITSNKFTMFNCQDLFSARDNILHIEFYNTNNQDINLHTEYQIVSEGLETSIPKTSIITKWIDSLVGYDKNAKEVPDPMLSPKRKYGNMDKPRQSWFVNRTEALKQFVERANYTLSKNLIIGEYNLTKLLQKDPIPLEVYNLYDITLDTQIELNYIGTQKLEQAIVEPVIVNGRIQSINIINPGKGYMRPPSYEIVGSGIDANIEFTINELGSILTATVINSGYGYLDNTRIILRPFSALVVSDNSINGKWAIYNWNAKNELWTRQSIQDFDVNLYWSYIDWYADGYNQFTNVTHFIEGPFDLPRINVNIGEIVKIENVGSGGWLLLQKENNFDNDFDYTVNYKTIGKQNGTIEISKGLYDFSFDTSSFDAINYDSAVYDNVPIKETRAIIEALKDDIFTDDLQIEFNKLFFASIKYVLSEQLYVDWIFKTSFVKAKHNFGDLSQKITYQNDNLASYESYVKEVKPFKTKIREYLSSYSKVESTNSLISDFDLSPIFDPITNKVRPPKTIVLNNEIQNLDNLDYPNLLWSENNLFYVKEIVIKDAGSKYTTTPIITLEGGGGTGAKAEARVHGGKVTSIIVTHPGYGYVNPPLVVIDGSIQDGGSPATAHSIIANDSVRKLSTKIKFDRISKSNVLSDIKRVEQFTLKTNQLEYELHYPLNSNNDNLTVRINGQEILSNAFVFGNKEKKLQYTNEIGFIKFNNPPTQNSVLEVEYQISQNYLSAIDRIKNYYDPTAGMFGQDLGQLMSGIDYGGVEVRSFDFNNLVGWDSEGWFSDTWDTYDITFEDIIKPITNFQTSIPVFKGDLQPNIEYNIYIGQQGQYADRIDDPNWVKEYDVLTETRNNYEIITQELLNLRSSKNQTESSIVENENNKIALSNENSSLLAEYPTASSARQDEIDQRIDEISDELEAIGSETEIDTILYNLTNTLAALNTEISNTQNDLITLQQEIDNLVVFLEDYPLVVTNAGMTPIQEGELAVFDVISNGSAYIVSVQEGGKNYSLNDKIIIPGNILRGVIFDNDVEITVTSVDTQGAIEEISHTGQPGNNVLAETQGIQIITFPQRFNEDSTAKTAILRKVTSDGTFIPEENTFDTQLSGGSLEYSNAKGIESGEIIVDGDGFVTPTTSSGPEEQVPGQVLDSLDIKVFDRVGAGSSIIVARNYIADYALEESTVANKKVELDQAQSSYDIAVQSLDLLLTNPGSTEQEIAAQTLAVENLSNNLQNKQAQYNIAVEILDEANTPYELGELPASKNSVIVRVNRQILQQDEYTINFNERTVKIINAPPTGSIISTLTFTTNGANILDIGNFVSDGETLQFLTNVEWQDGLTAYVAVDGERYTSISTDEVQQAKLVKSDSTYQEQNKVIIEFATPVSENSVVNYVIYASETQTYSEVTIDQLLGDGSTAQFELSQTPFNNLPLNTNTVVIVDNKILSPGYKESFRLQGSISYQLDITQYPPYSLLYIEEEPITVFLNSKLLKFGIDYTWLPENSSLELNQFLGQEGDLLEVYVKNQEYDIDDNGITFKTTPASGSSIIVYQFSNHDILNMERIEKNIVFRDFFVADRESFEKYSPRTAGIFRLAQPAFDISYVWVTKNQDLLVPNFDYFLSQDKEEVKINTEINDNDKIEIIHFTGQPVSTKFGFRQFKDILNRTHYKRLNKDVQTRLKKDLLSTDLRIEVEDASVLSSPNRNKNIPGIIFVNGERIEYMIKDGNLLRQLRRGTLGTSVNEFISSGTIVEDQGSTQTMPYQDKSTVSNYTAGFRQEYKADGLTKTFLLGKRLSNYENTLLGDLEVTVTKETSPGIFQQVILDENEYQLGILNGENVIIFNTPPTRISLDDPGVIEIILTNQRRFSLDFNPGKGGINEFEVFVAGTRLRKNAIEIFNSDAEDPKVNEILDAEFKIYQYTLPDGNTKTDLIIDTDFAESTTVSVIRKQGQMWKPSGVSLKDANSLQATFLREATIDLPK